MDSCFRRNDSLSRAKKCFSGKKKSGFSGLKNLSFREKSKNEPIDFYPESAVLSVQEKNFDLLSLLKQRIPAFAGMTVC
jgi:hypothetical protein